MGTVSDPVRLFRVANRSTGKTSWRSHGKYSTLRLFEDFESARRSKGQAEAHSYPRTVDSHVVQELTGKEQTGGYVELYWVDVP